MLAETVRLVKRHTIAFLSAEILCRFKHCGIVLTLRLHGINIFVQGLYFQLKLEALKLEDLTNVLSKQDQRAMVRDMISQVILENTTPEPNESEQLNVQSLDPTSASSPTAATVS